MINIVQTYAAQRSQLNRTDIFDVSSESLGRGFIAHLGLDGMPFSKLIMTFRNDVDEQVDPALDESAFYRYVSKRWVVSENLVSGLLERYRNATSDLQEIAASLEKIHIELDQINKEKRPSAAQRYDRKRLIYFEEKNKKAQTEILDFLTFHIKRFVLNEHAAAILVAPAFPIGHFGRPEGIPYRYGYIGPRLRSPYDPESVSETSNKFLDFPMEAYREMQRMYREEQNNFFIVAREYLKGALENYSSASARIASYADRSPILAPRRELLTRLTSMFDDGDFIGFVNISPLQIEGIFTDICVALGASEAMLDVSSVNSKLDVISPKIRGLNDIQYEYFSFKFPLVRNRVAHGEVFLGDYEHAAIMLMLDLLPVCHLTVSDEIVTNKQYKALIDAEFTRRLDKVLMWLADPATDLPDFYHWKTARRLLVLYVNTQSFWLDMRLSAAEENDDGVEKLIAAAKAIRKNRWSSHAQIFIKEAGCLLDDRRCEREKTSVLLKELLGAKKPSNS
jgi:hypothetical protein